MIKFFIQYKTLLWKNVLLKRRNKKQLFQELFFPIYYVAILAAIKFAIPTDEKPAITNIPSYSLFQSSVYHVDPNKPILVAPDNSEIQNLANESIVIFQELMNITDVPSLAFFPNETAMASWREANQDNVSAGIIFDYLSGNNLSYAIRFETDAVPGTENNYFTGQGGCRTPGNGLDTCEVNKYLHSGFAYYQVAIDTAIIRKQLNKPDFPAPDVSIQMMPKDKYSPNINYIQIISAIYFVLAYSPFVQFLVTNLVTEKEKKIKEGMKMMGMQDAAFWLSWGTIYLLLIAVVTIPVVVIAVAAKFFSFSSNFFIFYIILLFYGLSIVAISCVLAAFFMNPKTAGGIASLFTIVFSLLYLVVSLTRSYTSTGEVVYSISVAVRWILCLISPCAVALALDQGIYLDLRGGMTFESARHGEFPLYAPLIMLLVDTILYFLLAIYLDNIVPGPFGAKLKPYFCLQKSYWFPGDRERVVSGDQESPDKYFGTNVERAPAELRENIAVKISGISKEFDGKDGKVKAVNDLSLEMYHGQITGLLGHNGAGKTTLINMLTGLTTPTKGTAFILGMDVSDANDLIQIRSMTGVCPQHNILFDLLTVEEHLQIYGGLRGVDKNTIQAEIDKVLEDVNLSDQKDVRSKTLSGGQKRKLSVAIALIGDPKIIFLDEPTAGMDPYSRRHLWSILKEKKKDKVILLTTHFMDEADILADRKAIISKGKLRCCGSSLFLKNKFGIGYHLNMVVDPNCDVDGITHLIQNHIEDAEFKRIHGKELAFTLPMDKVNSFPALFSSLEEQNTSVSTRAEAMGIKTYGVSMTTLEEVFLKLEEDDESIDLKEFSAVPQSPKKADAANGVKYGSFAILHNDDTSINMENNATIPDCRNNVNASQQFWALARIKFISNTRNKPLLVMHAILPVIFVIIGLMLQKYLTVSDTTDSDPVPLSILNTLARYVGLNSSLVTTSVSALLLKDSVSSADSQQLVNSLKSNVKVDSYSNVSDLLAIAPHNLGLELQTYNVNTVNEVIDSQFKILYNDSAIHSLPLMIDMVSQSLLSAGAALANVSLPSGMSFNTTSLPWKSFKTRLQYSQSAFSASILIAMAFTTIPPAFGVDLTTDRQTKVRSQLRATGIKSSIYFAAYFFVDTCKYFIPAILTIIVILAFQVDALFYGGAILSVILLFLTYIPANTLFAYALSFLFSDAETAQNALTTIFFLAGFLPFIAISLIDMIAYETLTGVAAILHYVFCAIDCPYIIFGGIYYLTRLDRVKKLSLQSPEFSDFFDPGNHILGTILIPIAHCFLWFFLLRVLDVRSTGGDVREAFPCVQKSGVQVEPHENSDIFEEDEDVAAERQRVASFHNRALVEYPVALVENLRKEFAKEGKSKYKGCTKVKEEERIKIAVRNATLAVDAGEVFGLLGPNGAGKTTVLNMMIAEVGPTKGDVIIGGHSVRSSMSDAFQAMGYCPQHDALWPHITLKEHMDCYAAIRGIPKDEIRLISSYFTENLKIAEHKDKQAKKLSGGTKRKLSYAMSMMGKPRIVLLDEPSTGMDPKSKRFLWDTISSNFSGSERGAVLTTHYMEEADALCSRVAIMVNGKIECIGATQHLKNKYGSGYLLEVKLRSDGSEAAEVTNGKMKNLEQYLYGLFPSAICMEQFGLRSQFKVPKENVSSLAQTFSALEEGKSSHSIEEYSFSQSTLEQVFLEFAKRQLDDNDSDNDNVVVPDDTTRITSIRL